jgi:predicted deacylase
MEIRRSLIAMDVDLEAAGVQRGYLRLPYSQDTSAYGHIPIPIVVARNGEGPTVLLTGGVHGDEYEGPIALARLICDLTLQAIRGRIIVVPSLNLPALLAGKRLSPIDGINLNRCFPGDRNGSPTNMIAHFVETELLVRADYCFDFHSGGSSLKYLPTLIAAPPRTAEQRAVYEQLIAAFRPPRLLYMDMLGEDRTIGAAAERRNVYFLTGEFGGAAEVCPDGLETLDRGLRNMLTSLGVFKGECPPTPLIETQFLSVKGSAHYLFAPKAGIFEPRFRLGEEVQAGQVAGYIHEPLTPWDAPAEIRFEGDGIAICMRANGRVSPGDCLGHLASEQPKSTTRVEGI